MDDVQVRTFLQESAADVVFQGSFNLGDSVTGISDVNADGIDDAAIVDAGASTGQIYFRTVARADKAPGPVASPTSSPT